MKILKKVLAVFLIGSMFVSAFASALNPNDIMVTSNSDAFDLTSHSSDLNTKTGLYKYGASVQAAVGATSTYVSCVIQRRENGTYVNVPGSWVSVSRQSDYASVGNQYYVTKGYWYRTQATYIVHINGQEYKVVDNSDQYWYG